MHVPIEDSVVLEFTVADLGLRGNKGCLRWCPGFKRRAFTALSRRIAVRDSPCLACDHC